MDKLIMLKELWMNLLIELKTRGKGTRESGAFLLGTPAEPRIKKFICMDDLDPHSLKGGYIEFGRKGFSQLWKICETENLKVFADIHTHPSSWIGQSIADETHPMIHQAGHLAIIVPNFASNITCSLKGVGMYEYKGSGIWKPHYKKSKVFTIEIAK